MPDKRQRLLEYWNQCAATELRGQSPVVKELARHYFMAGAMGMYALVFHDLAEMSKEDRERAVVELRDEMFAHMEKLHQLAEKLNVPIGRM